MSETNLNFDELFAEATKSLIDDTEQEVDIVTFCENPYYLDQPLHGVEKFILKIYYGIPLDNTNKTIRVRFFPYDKEGVFFTEEEYLKFLTEQERCNVSNIHEVKKFIELVLVCGRRSGKTFIASAITAYEAYKLILKNDPQKYYKLPQGEEIRIINVASTTDQAIILATAVKNRILNSKWFKPYVFSKTQSEIRLRTKHDLALYNDELKLHGKAIDDHVSVKIMALPCTARGIRGGTVIVGILDEFAHYVDNDGNRSGDKVYEALTPSIATFGLDGKILCLSSPGTKSGIFYDLYLDSAGVDGNEPDPNKLMFKIPSWEMNDTLTFEYLNSEKKRNPESFTWEFGADFCSVMAGFIRFPEKIDECIKKDSESNSPKANHNHYIAVDPSSNNNGYAIAMVHVEIRQIEKIENNRKFKENQKIVVLDKWKVWNLKDPEFEGLPYIDEEIVHDYIESLCQRFFVAKLVYDQFDSSQSVLKFRKLGVDAIKTPFSRGYNTKMYKNLRDLIYEGRLELFRHDLGILELKCLQEKRVGKRQIIVEAPKQGEATTDDLADVLANACSVACDYESGKQMRSATGTNGTTHYNSSGINATTAQGYKRLKAFHKTTTNFDKAKNMGLLAR
jgi:hypothetical protein